MKKRLVRNLYPALIAVSILALLGVSACASEPEPEPREPVPLTSPELSRAAGGESVPVSRDLVLEFASDQAAINEDWDQFHVDFDNWRARLSACDRTAALEALRAFAGDFSAITEQARDLPGKGIARELPDNAIKAASGEEAALRMLRDKWQPGNPALLENAQTERGAAADLMRATAIEVDKLEELDKPEDQAIAEDFASALVPVEEAWESFYDNYGQLEDDHIELGAPEIVDRLRSLAEEHESVMEGLANIPSDKVTDPVHDQLSEAAETEAEGLEDLLDAFRRIARAEAQSENESNGDSQETGNGNDDGEGNDNDSDGDSDNGQNPGASSEDAAAADSSDTSDAPQGSADGQKGGLFSLGEAAGEQSAQAQSAGNGGSSPVPPIPFIRATPIPNAGAAAPQAKISSQSSGDTDDFSAHFDTFEDTLDETRAVRKKAVRDLETIIEEVDEEDKQALADFTKAFAELTDNWDDFHEEFDQWVRTEGDCDRSGAIYQLDLLNQRFSELGARVRELSQASYLRPSSDLLAEAVEVEGAALRGLRATWAPYESDVYRGLDDKRANAIKLRRLADRRTLEVMERNAIQQ